MAPLPKFPAAPPTKLPASNSGLVHLGHTAAEQRARDTPRAVPSTSEDSYPYGLGVSLENGSMQKLGITHPPAAGSTVHATVKMHVDSVSKSTGKSGHAMGLTITHMKLHGAAAPKVSGRVSRVRAPTAKVGAPKPIHVVAHVRRARGAAPRVAAPRAARVKAPTVRRVK